MADPVDNLEAPSAKPWSGGGREQLADAVRRLMSATVTTVASPELLDAAAHRIEELADGLERHVPEPGPVPTARFADRSVRSEEVATLAAAMPFDMVIGTCNPVALPIVVEFEPPMAVGRGTFTPPYEGAPGCVHGAVLAATFDMMLTAANVIADAAGPTVTLTIRYLKPTLIAEPALFEAWVTTLDRRRTHSRGRLLQNGVVTVEAEGEFVTMERSRIASLHRRDGAPDRSGPDGGGR
jgi:acyl-coenzyme A thioesterase PaaI-like protein